MILEDEIKYTKDYLVKLDENIEMVPLTLDCAFKKVFGHNLELLKKFLIITLHLPIDEENCSIKLENSEQPKYNKRDYQMTFDVTVTLNNNITVTLEMNSEYFENIKERNLLYFEKKRVSMVESGDNPQNFSNFYLYQLNLNSREKNVSNGESVIVYYDLITKKVFSDNRIMVLKYLEYYRNLYYTEGNKEEEVMWLVGLTSRNFSELYDIFSQLLPLKQLQKLIEDVINMSKDVLILHEWEKEKMEALVAYTKEKNQKKREEEFQKKEKELKKSEEELKKSEQELKKSEQELKKSEQELKEKEDKLHKDLESFQKEKVNIAKEMIQNGIDINLISKYTKLSVCEIERLK